MAAFPDREAAMYEGKILFAQIIEHLPRKALNNAIARHNGDYKVKDFTCRDQLLAMLFAQLTLRDGLRGIEATLRVNGSLLYHMGFRCQTISRNTLANANEGRPWQIWAELAMVLMKKARALYANQPLAIDLDAKVFALDSTTIDLCLSRFPWTPSMQSKAGVKMHVLLDLHGDIPDFVVISHGKMHDVNFLDTLTYVPGAYYVMDRGYMDFNRLYRLHQRQAFYVTRARKNLQFAVAASDSSDRAAGVICDQTIRLIGRRTQPAYPEPLRRIKYRDPQGKTLVFLTNNFALPALMIAALYKQRWQIELFFKWIKQHLKIKKFYGYSENAVRTQLWIAVAAYCLLAIIKKQLGGDRDLHEIQEILSASIFRKIPLVQAFSNIPVKTDSPYLPNQPSLFEL